MIKEKKYFGHFEYLKGLLTIDRTLSCTNISFCKIPLFRQEERKTKIISHFLGIHVHSIEFRNFIKLPVKEIFFQNLNADETFSRLDIIVHLLAIENELGINDFGWDFYTKMQTNICGKEQAEIEKNNFKEFINLYLNNRSLQTEPLVINKDLKITHNAQQLAFSIFNKEKDIIVEVKKDAENQNNFDRLFFIASGFSIPELKRIEDRLTKAKEDIGTCQFDAFLWPPVLSFFDEITDKMSLFYKVKNYKDILFDEHAFSIFIKSIYHFDEIADWKINKKIEYLKPFFPKKVRCLTLEASHPVFSFKNKKNKFSFLRNIVKMKNAIRNVYRTKIENYHFDIITHSADNTTQSDYMNDIIHSDFDLFKLLSYISKTDVLVNGIKNIQDIEDIKNFPFCKDICIFCKKENSLEVLSKIKEFFENNLNQKYNYKIVNNEDNAFSVSLFVKDNLIYKFSVNTVTENFNESFSDPVQIENIFTTNLTNKNFS